MVRGASYQRNQQQRRVSVVRVTSQVRQLRTCVPRKSGVSLGRLRHRLSRRSLGSGFGCRARGGRLQRSRGGLR